MIMGNGQVHVYRHPRAHNIVLLLIMVIMIINPHSLIIFIFTEVITVLLVNSAKHKFGFRGQFAQFVFCIISPFRQGIEIVTRVVTLTYSLPESDICLNIHLFIKLDKPIRVDEIIKVAVRLVVGICVLEFRGSLCLIGILQVILRECQVFLCGIFYITIYTINHTCIVSPCYGRKSSIGFPSLILCFLYIAVEHKPAQVVALHCIDAVKQSTAVCIDKRIAAEGGTQVVTIAIIPVVIE